MKNGISSLRRLFTKSGDPGVPRRLTLTDNDEGQTRLGESMGLMRTLHRRGARADRRRCAEGVARRGAPTIEWGSTSEERVVDGAHRPRRRLLPHHEVDGDVARAEADHLDVDAGGRHGLQDAGRTAGDLA